MFTKLGAAESIANDNKFTVLDYSVEIKPLDATDTLLAWSVGKSNWTLSGFQIYLERHATKYIIQFYITSALLVVVSWVRYVKIVSKSKYTK